MANRLAYEKSLYLRQHADNPVDWYPWGPEAFARAQQEDKPVFLSIGYSACHWCHVMERESFADPEVARILNEHFICIKVDREERPDIDTFYMHACQAMTGHGGWPLTIIMTADKRPFFAATYIPKTDRFGRPGLLRLLPEIAQLWRSHRQELLDYAERVLDFLRHRHPPVEGHPSEELLQQAFAQLQQQWDERYGGLSGAPKFPMVPQLLFLLHWWYRTGAEEPLKMVEHTLFQMRLGGLYDHIGFGFHRYTTDERWRLPHFEKMLSDQALLTIVYATAFQIQRSPLWAQTVTEVLHYCHRQLRSPEGTFYTSEDADSAGEEGAFYLWTDGELRTLLEPEEYEFLRFAFGVEPSGNLPGRPFNHLFQTAPWEALAERYGTSPLELQQRWEVLRQRLLRQRQRRIPPQRDEKVLTDWNGLMLAALSIAARSLGEESYTDSAQQLAAFFLTHWQRHGQLFHCYTDGQWAIPGMLDDYAFLLWGLLELYTTTLQPPLLDAALNLAQQLYNRFWDARSSSFFPTAPEASELPIRYRSDGADGATPSGSAVACWCFLRLGHITGEPYWHTRAEEALSHPPQTLFQFPMAFPWWLIALDLAFGPTSEVCLLAQRPNPLFRELLTEVHRSFLPRTILTGAAGHLELFRRLAPGYGASPLQGEALAYVCTEGRCLPPVQTASDLARLLPQRTPPGSRTGRC